MSAPLPSAPAPAGPSPGSQLLRFGELLTLAGLSEWTLRQIIATGALGGAPLWPGGHRYFLRSVADHVLFGLPLPSCPFGLEPKPCLLRRADVLAWTGLREKQFRRIMAHGLLAGETSRTRAGGKTHFRKAIIRTALFMPLLPQSWPPHPLPITAD
jgi:hypothetical protein